jgi:transposase InsO family protein
MARKRYTAEEIIGQLRTIEIELGKGLAVVEACRKLGITEQNCGMNCSTANSSFYTLHEARVIVEGWRQRYNTHRPHSALGYRPPAPETRTVAPLSVSA